MDNLNWRSENTKHHAVKITKEGERSVRKGHPWIFETSITKLNPSAKNGDRAIIFDKKKNQFMGIGLIDPFSMIRIKVISLKKVEINLDFFLQGFKKALDVRIPLIRNHTNSYRLIFGENDHFPGLIIDVYAGIAVVKLYSTIWIPYKEYILSSLLELNEDLRLINSPIIQTVVLRLSRNTAKLVHPKWKDGDLWHGSLDEQVVIFKEHGVLFSADVIHGHKTGYFLDHRSNRKSVGELSSRKTVLDVFSYAGGFSVHALVGGAKEVTSIDISKQALELARFNAELNGDYTNHNCLDGDAFEQLSQLQKQGKSYDLVIVDPPSFAKSAREIEGALHSYRRLARLTIPLVRTSGIAVMASCSSRITSGDFYTLMIDEFTKERQFEIIQKTGHDIDHPVIFPEGAYLKTIYFKKN